VRRGWAKGFSRPEALEFIAKHDGQIGKITFDNKEVTQKHRTNLIEMSRLWREVKLSESELRPKAAQREKNRQ